MHTNSQNLMEATINGVTVLLSFDGFQKTLKNVPLEYSWTC